MSTDTPLLPPPPPPRPSPPRRGGRERLVEAALEIVASTRTLATLGIREVTRGAGLAPNAFYRHFRDLDQLGLNVIERLGTDLRAGLRTLRQTWQDRHPEPVGLDPAALGGIHEVIAGSVGFVLEFVARHETAYTVGIRLLHGNSPVLRHAMEQLLERCAADMAEDVQGLLGPGTLPPETGLDLSRAAIRQMSFFATDYLQRPDERARVRAEAERFILRLFVGEAALLRAGDAGAGAGAGTGARPRTRLRAASESPRGPETRA